MALIKRIFPFLCKILQKGSDCDTIDTKSTFMERMTGIEPATSAWKAEMLASTLHPHGPASFVYSEGSRKQSLRFKLIFVCTIYTIDDTLPLGTDRVRNGIPNFSIEPQ